MEIKTSKELNNLAQLFKDKGTTLYIVGGYVRDYIRGKISHDIDLAVENSSIDMILEIIKPLATHYTTNAVGGVKAVIKATINNIEYDFALCRGDVSKGDATYKGFDIVTENITILMDLERRDFTMNSMAYNILTKELIDPFNGQEDLKNRIIRHTGKHFSEDALRVLRLCRFKASTGFDVCDTTIELSRSLDCSNIPSERFSAEIFRVLSELEKPSVFFDMMHKVGWLEKVLPELHALINIEQSPKNHPEIWAYTHTMHCLDSVQDKVDDVYDHFTRMAVICHDLGKATTQEIKPNGKISFINHEEHSRVLSMTMLSRIKYDNIIGNKGIYKISILCKYHMLHCLKTISDGALAKIVWTLEQNSLQFIDLVKVMFADESGRPPIVPNYDFINQLIKRVVTMKEAGRFIPFVTSNKLKDEGVPDSKLLGDLIKKGMFMQLKGSLKPINWINDLQIKHHLSKYKEDNTYSLKLKN